MSRWRNKFVQLLKNTSYETTAFIFVVIMSYSSFLRGGHSAVESPHGNFRRRLHMGSPHIEDQHLHGLRQRVSHFRAKLDWGVPSIQCRWDRNIQASREGTDIVKFLQLMLSQADSPWASWRTVWLCWTTRRKHLGERRSHGTFWHWLLLYNICSIRYKNNRTFNEHQL